MKRLLLLTAIFLSGCAGTTAVGHYQSCNAIHTNLSEVLACGKKTRNEYCLAANKCSSNGDVLVAYFDRLGHQLKTNQISPEHARLLYATKIRDAEMEILQHRRNLAEEMGRMGAETMNTWGGGSNTPTQRTGHLSRQTTSGQSKICYYYVSGIGDKALNLKSTEICPPNYVFSD